MLLSPLTTNKTPLRIWFRESEDLHRAEQQARAMVADDRGGDLIPLRGWYHAISAASLVQRFDEPDGTWERNVRCAESPILMAWGDAEPRYGLWERLYADFARPQDRKVVLDGAGHYYRGQERQLAAAVAGFLTDVGLLDVPKI